MLPKTNSIQELKTFLFIATELTNMPTELLLDSYFSAMGTDTLLLDAKELLNSIDYIEQIIEELSQPLQKYSFGDYFLREDVTMQPFVKYFLFEKMLKHKLKTFAKTETADILLLCSIFLDKNTDKEDYFDLKERKKRALTLENDIDAVDIYRCYYGIIEQINSLAEIYPDYYTFSNDNNFRSPEADFYEKNALELQMKHIAEINHCKISDVYMFSIDEVFTYISILNKKNKIENEKISRNI